MKKVVLAACLGIFLFGCAKDPVAVDPPFIPSLSSCNISSSLFSTICIRYNGVSYDTFGVAALDVKIIGKFHAFDYIKASSDTISGFCYLHNSKMIEIPFDHPLPPYCSFQDTSNESLWVVYCFNYFFSDPLVPYAPLTADDTLTFVDSTVAVFSWWYGDDRYSVRRKL